MTNYRPNVKCCKKDTFGTKAILLILLTGANLGLVLLSFFNKNIVFENQFDSENSMKCYQENCSIFPRSLFT